MNLPDGTSYLIADAALVQRRSHERARALLVEAAADPIAAAQLVELAASLGVRARVGVAILLGDAIELVAAAVASGEIVMLLDEPKRVGMRPIVARDDVPDAPRDPVVPPRTERDDVLALEVVDDAGRPVALAEFTIELSDGSVVEGRLGTDGRARLEGVPAGRGKLRLRGMPMAAAIEVGGNYEL